MPGDPAAEWPLLPVRPACPPFDLSTLERQGWDLLGRFSDAVDYAGPITFGVAAWASSCRLMWLMRWLKTDDGDGVELDPVG
jgi:hypothetical protein